MSREELAVVDKTDYALEREDDGKDDGRGRSARGEQRNRNIPMLSKQPFP